jgi:hypothetical protein
MAGFAYIAPQHAEAYEKPGSTVSIGNSVRRQILRSATI